MRSARTGAILAKHLSKVSIRALTINVEHLMAPESINVSVNVVQIITDHNVNRMSNTVYCAQ